MLYLKCLICLFLPLGLTILQANGALAGEAGGSALELAHATVVVRPKGAAPIVEQSAATILIEEIQKRTGIRLNMASVWPKSGAVLAILSGKSSTLDGVKAPDIVFNTKPEGYSIVTDRSHADRPVLWIAGSDPRGALFAVGKLLRTLECRTGSVRLTAALPQQYSSSPEYPIRGHQLGYRSQANSYDAWTPEQFDQYIRELAMFGTNSIEGIPFEDDRPTVNSYPRSKMNVDLSRICAKYGQDYWIWVPADFDLTKQDRRKQALEQHAELFHECPTLTGVFVAGGDPGDNPPDLVIPYLADLAAELAKHHPKARVWLSMQGYSLEHQDQVYRWIQKDRPRWLGGIVAGPSSPPLAELRSRLPANYPIRDYPDITHSVRCQFPVPYWDPAFGFTLGRECANPRPLFFARVFRDTAPFTQGFISYSDGCHDDVNKILWSALAWDSSADPNTILTEYCRLFFGPDAAETAAAGVLAFERNWEGALATNGGVDATFALWKTMEAEHPDLQDNWRWQLCLLRAYYDIYTRKRLIFETQLEDLANDALRAAPTIGADTAMTRALDTLKQADTQRVYPEYSNRVEQLCDRLFHSIGLQTSVSKYGASGSERGCVLDFLYYPLNNRWWLEDQVAAVRALGSEQAKSERLRAIANWEHPGAGSYYDDIGNIARSPHEDRNEKIGGPLLDVDNLNLPGLMFWVEKDPLARARHSWFCDEAWPTAIKYPHVDTEADYTIRTTGCGECLLKVNGVRVTPTLNGRKVGELKEFPVPRSLYRNGAITVTFDPTFEPDLNWRVQSRLTEIWLIKK